MKKILLATGLIAVIGIGCLKNDEDNYKPCTDKSVQDEMSVMTKFATDSAISTTQDATGLLYQVIEPGTGATPTSASTVVAKYVGRFMDGKGFDSSYKAYPGGVEFQLNRVIPGWTLGIPKIKAGGKLKLIIPSSLAYGCAGSRNPYTGEQIIASNQPLYFYVELVSVK